MTKLAPPPQWKRAKSGPTPVSPEGPEAAKALEAIALGNHIDVACMAAGISRSMYSRWMKIAKVGGKEAAPYVRFRDRAYAALAQAEQTLQGRVEVASKTTWQAAAFLLERRFHRRWSKHVEQKSEVSVKEVKLPHNISLLPPELVRPYLLALTTMESSAELKAQFQAAYDALEGASA